MGYLWGKKGEEERGGVKGVIHGCEVYILHVTLFQSTIECI